MWSRECTHMRQCLWRQMCFEVICPRAARVFIESPGPGDKSHLNVYKKIYKMYNSVASLLGPIRHSCAHYRNVLFFQRFYVSSMLILCLIY